MSDTPRCNELINKHGFITTRNGDKAVLVSDYRFSEDAFALARQLERELTDKDRQLTEARADADHWKSECNALQRMVHEARAEIERKDKVIEQMRSALKALRKYPNTYLATGQGAGIAEKDLAMCDAALAAERGE